MAPGPVGELFLQQDARVLDELLLQRFAREATVWRWGLRRGGFACSPSLMCSPANPRHHHHNPHPASSISDLQAVVAMPLVSTPVWAHTRVFPIGLQAVVAMPSVSTPVWAHTRVCPVRTTGSGGNAFRYPHLLGRTSVLVRRGLQPVVAMPRHPHLAGHEKHLPT